MCCWASSLEAWCLPLRKSYGVLSFRIYTEFVLYIVIRDLQGMYSCCVLSILAGFSKDTHTQPVAIASRHRLRSNTGRDGVNSDFSLQWESANIHPFIKCHECKSMRVDVHWMYRIACSGHCDLVSSVAMLFPFSWRDCLVSSTCLG